ncbi:YtxH domain-containing protein [Flavobacterium stagni]|uniref:YtxH domain-containing protein n=1 Tax=Flavobacterium stagni TaxID=2506421 RepID=A0A4Q1KAE3_9FLAO|nr:YtxH domain-containing protein [Flavobacterium stagni]RXR23225.1 YtxH domain-containing protein [Flavobacterium stagni]
MKMKNVGMALGGLIAGSVVGALIAPEKGKNTRNKIAEKGKKLLTSAQNGIAQITTFGNAPQENEEFDHLDNLRSINKHLM